MKKASIYSHTRLLEEVLGVVAVLVGNPGVRLMRLPFGDTTILK
jgi:hypothetical protein